MTVVESTNHYCHCLPLFTAEVSAVLKLDNVEIGQTQWKNAGPQCWSQQFLIDVERVSVNYLTLYSVALLLKTALVT